MKHTHRKDIGLELYFANRSSTFSGLNEYTSADVDSLLEHAPAVARYPLAHVLHESLVTLMEWEHFTPDLIPENIARLAVEYSAVQCCGRQQITDFFGWLLDLARRNETDRAERIAGLNTVASDFDRATASFIRTGLALNNQRVVISRSGDTISISYAERDWGRVFIDFENCTINSSAALPMTGYIFSCEAEKSNGCYEFRFLVDTCFSDIDYCERLLQDKGWHELAFTCPSVRVRMVCCDYAGRLERIGTPRAELIDRASSILLSKYNIVGQDALSVKEAAMLPIARFITGTTGLLSSPRSKRWQSEQLVLDSLDNRYATQQLSQLLRECKCTDLHEKLSVSGSSRFEDDDHKALVYAHRFASQYERQLACGSSRELTMKLADRFCEMTSDFSDSTLRLQAECDAAKQIADAIHPQLSTLKFEGQFPHYYRKKRFKTEYLSVMLMPATELSRHGLYTFNVSLAAAHLSKKHIRQLCEQGVDLDRANALDCQPEIFSACRYGELASADDGEYVRIDADLFGLFDTKSLRNDTHKLNRYIKLANRQFRWGRIPNSYAVSRLRKNTLPSPAPRLFLASLPLSAVLSLLAVIVWLGLTNYFSLPELSLVQALCCAAGTCLILNSAITIVRRLFIAGSLWRYRG